MDKLVEKTTGHVKDKLLGEGTGHDWWHVYRVWKNAVHIGEKEDCDLLVVELAALLHDIADWKFHDGDDSAGPKAAREWLESLDANEELISHVCDIIRTVSYKGANVETPMKTKEGMVVQDADRLDAMGAMGIARAFAYGGNMGRELYNPAKKPEMHDSFDDYKKSDRKNEGHTINHFYEKLLLLKDRMNTETAKKIAQGRHEYMEGYLDRFYKEWEGEL